MDLLQLCFLTYVSSVLWQFLINLSKCHIWIISFEIRMSHIFGLLHFCMKCVYIAGLYILIAGVTKITSLLRSYTMSNGKHLIHISKDLIRLLDSEAEGLIILMYVTIYQSTWCNIPEDLYLFSCQFYKYNTVVAKIWVFSKWILFFYFVVIIVFDINLFQIKLFM
jgi:hypothetical protein